MDTDRIIEALGTLRLTELRRIKARLDELISTMEAWQAPEQAQDAGGKTYRQEYTKCNKASCKACTEGQGHGPYWYAYWREGGKLRKQYIGKERPHNR